ncbi:MAG TPA: hypothetical protein VGL81_06215 [Polyangiaceae bacterium]|jgi:hypothetical protein
MRGKLVFLVILAMLVGLLYLVASRTRDAHVMPKPRLAEVREAAAPPASAPSASASTEVPVAAADAAVESDAKAALLDRPMRLVASTWEQAAAALVANGGKSPADGGVTSEQGLDLRVDVASSDQDIDNRLARGGGDPEGADVAVMPLPAFVASYERIRALEPQIVHVVGWSRGREVLLGAREGMLAKPGALGADVTVVSVDPSATVLALFVLDEVGTPPARVHLVADSKTAALAALARPIPPDRPADAPSRVLLTTAEATRLVPLVAVAARGFVEGHEAAMTALLRAWDKGATELRKDVPAAARRIAGEPGAPEPATMLERLGWMSDPGRADERDALGSGASGGLNVADGPLTVGRLFARDWQLLRDAGVLTSPTPSPPPVDPGPFLHAFPTLVGAAPSSPVTPPGDGARVLLARRFAKGDTAAVASSITSLAGVFDRSVVRVTTKPPSLAKDAADAAMARGGLPAERIVVVPTALAEPGVALVEVLAAP